RRRVGGRRGRPRPRLGRVARPADHLEARRVLQDHPQAGPDQRLVVGQHHPDRHGPSPTGSTAYPRNPPAGLGPATRLPPSRVARSRMPSSPPPARAPPAASMPPPPARRAPPPAPPPPPWAPRP